MDRPEGLDRKAKKHLKDPERIERLIEQSLDKAETNQKTLGKVWKDLRGLIRLLRMWAKGRYTEVPWKTLVAITGTLIYFLNPFDLMPDFIPVSGFLDDASLIAVTISLVRRDLDAFYRWERKKQPSADR